MESDKTKLMETIGFYRHDSTQCWGININCAIIISDFDIAQCDTTESLKEKVAENFMELLRQQKKFIAESILKVMDEKPVLTPLDA